MRPFRGYSDTMCNQPISRLPVQLFVTQRGPVYKTVRHSQLLTDSSLLGETTLLLQQMHFGNFQKPVPIIWGLCSPIHAQHFSYQYRQKILLTRQLAGTINQVVKSPKSGLYGQRQTSRHPKAPKQPEFIIEILFAEAKVLSDNNPSAGAPTKTLLRIFFFL